MQNSQFIIPDHYNCILALLTGVHQPDVLGMKVTNGICVDTWTRLEWIPKVMTSAVNVVVFGPLLVMVALYSRVVYDLWFKSNDENQISNQQKVNVLI